jgi:hypothetical protein
MARYVSERVYDEEAHAVVENLGARSKRIPSEHLRD